MTEAKLTLKCVRRLRAAGAFVSKIHGGPRQSSGLPDIVGCYRGLFFGIEMKMPGKENTLTEKQAEKLDKIREAGGIAVVATSVRDCLDVLARIDEYHGD